MATQTSGITDTVTRIVKMAPRKDVELIKKTIQGLKAKCRWHHVSEGQKKAWEAEIIRLEQEMQETDQ